MISYTNVVILDKDFDKGLVKRQNYKGNIEYWIYRQKEGKLFLPDGKKNLLQDKKDSFLYCIVVCDSEHVVKRNKEGILVRGCKLTAQSVNKYLTKTNRHVD